MEKITDEIKKKQTDKMDRRRKAETKKSVSRISKELRRGERSVRMNLFFMDLIRENEVDQRF